MVRPFGVEFPEDGRGYLKLTGVLALILFKEGWTLKAKYYLSSILITPLMLFNLHLTLYKLGMTTVVPFNLKCNDLYWSHLTEFLYE